MAHHLSAPMTRPMFGGASAQKSRLISVGEAASRLGLHRSTLNLAIRRGLITPDLITAGGHARFSDATLDSYAERLRHAFATSASSSDTAASSLACRLEQTLAEPAGARLALEQTLRNLRERCPDFTRLCVIERLSASPASASSIAIRAQLGHTSQTLRRFLDMYPRVSMVTHRTLSSGEAIYVEDTMRQVVRESGTALLARRTGIRAVASAPLVFDNAVIGALDVASPHPVAFNERVRGPLQETAQEAALLLGYHQRMERQREWMSAVGALAQAQLDLLGLNNPGDETNASPARSGAALERLAQAFLRAHNAEEVCAQGAGLFLPPCSEPLRTLLQRLDADHPRLLVEWSDARGQFHALALRAPGSTPVMAAAVWRAEAAPCMQEREAALLTLLGVCALGAR